jgi:DNA-binding transcriptional MocR family regulator
LLMKPIATDTLLALVGRWSAGRGPLYLLLAGRLRALIDDGELAGGTRLPPDRTLAAALAIGRSTVIAAYDVLRQEGRVIRTQGSGTRVATSTLATSEAGRNPLFLHLLEASEDNVLQLTCASPEHLPPEFVDAQHAALDRLTATAGAGLGYHPAGAADLRAALATYFTNRGVPTEPAWILVTTGAQQALALLVRLLAAPGDTIVTEAPTYPGSIELFRDANAIIRTAAVTEDGLDLDACTEAITRYRPCLAYVTASFQNPTGTLVHELARRRLARVAGEAQVPLIDDEVLVDLGFDERPVPMAAYAPAGGVITVGSLSKVVWGGMRIGWIRANPAMISKLARLKTMHDLGGELLSQLAAAHLVPRMGEIRDRRVALLRARHDQLCAELSRLLPDWRFGRARGGQTLWVRLPCADAAAFAQTALRQGIAVLPGSAFDPSGGSRDCLRIPFLAEPVTVTRAVEQLATAWQRHDRGQLMR